MVAQSVAFSLEFRSYSTALRRRTLLVTGAAALASLGVAAGVVFLSPNLFYVSDSDNDRIEEFQVP